MRVYIAGPISGKPDRNRAAFAAAAEKLATDGHIPINPHWVDHTHDGPCVGNNPHRTGFDEGDDHKYGCYMKADIRALLECDAYVRLEGWEQSPGAYAESQVARVCGIQLVNL